jgi:hypothetical protein
VARTYNGDYHFLLVEIDRRTLTFQAIARSGQTIDAGVLYKDARDAAPAHASLTPQDRALLR